MSSFPFFIAVRDLLVTSLDVLEMLIVELLQIEQRGMRSFRYADQLIELDLHGLAVAILCILNQEHHQESHDRGARVDHQLPRVASASPDSRDLVGATRRRDHGHTSRTGMGDRPCMEPPWSGSGPRIEAD